MMTCEEPLNGLGKGNALQGYSISKKGRRRLMACRTFHRSSSISPSASHKPFFLIVHNITKVMYEFHVFFIQRTFAYCINILPKFAFVSRGC